MCSLKSFPHKFTNTTHLKEWSLQVWKYFTKIHSITKCVVFNKALKMIIGKMGVCRMFNSSLRLIGYPPDYLFPQIFSKLSYHKVASRSTSQLVALSDCLWRGNLMLMYLAKSFQNWMVDRSTARDFTLDNWDRMKKLFPHSKYTAFKFI